MRPSLGGWLTLLFSVLTAGLIIYLSTMTTKAVVVVVSLLPAMVVSVGFGLTCSDREGWEVLGGVLVVFGISPIALVMGYFVGISLGGSIPVLVAVLGLVAVWINVFVGGGLEELSDLLPRSIYVFLFMLLAGFVASLLGSFSAFVGGWFSFTMSSETRLLGAFLLEIMLIVFLIRRFENKLPSTLFPRVLSTKHLKKDRVAISYTLTFLLSLSLLASGFTGVLPSPIRTALFGGHIMVFVVAGVLWIFDTNLYIWKKTVGGSSSEVTQGLVIGSVSVVFLAVVTPIDDFIYGLFAENALVSSWETSSMFFLFASVGAITVFVLLIFVLLLVALGFCPDGSGGVGAGSMLLYGGVLLVAVGYGEPVLVFAAFAGSLIVWDVGENTMQAEKQLGRVTDLRGELVHSIAGVAVGVVAVTISTAGYIVSTSIGYSGSYTDTVAALALSLLGVLILIVSLK